MFPNQFVFMFISLLITTCRPGYAGSAGPDDFDRLREMMVRSQIEARDVTDEAVLTAMRTVPRHLFVPERQRPFAYNDSPLPIGDSQTISQPYVVAFMTEALELEPGHRVLEIGTGSGYQAAVLAEIAAEVYSMEILPGLGRQAESLLAELGYDNVRVRIGDGYRGWPEEAPFDRIIVTAAPENIPRALVDQLKEGGIIIVPVGPRFGVQELIRGVKIAGKLVTQRILSVQFVPMVPGE